MRQFEKEYRAEMPQTIGETDRQFDDHNYTEFLERWIAKLLATPVVMCKCEQYCECGRSHGMHEINNNRCDYCDNKIFP